MNAKVSEIFLSYQGEGPYAGSRQLFVRFYGCNLSCGYCDTPLESYKTFTREALLGKILDFEDDYNELVLTGGEPLLHNEFLAEFLPLFRKHRNHRVYLETNGVLSKELAKTVDMVDIVSMDIKLASTDPGAADLMDKHAEFIKTASGKELIVKAVVADSTSIDDIKALAAITRDISEDISIVLQPISPVGEEFSEPDGEMLEYFKGYIAKESGKDVMVLGQLHKHLGVK